LAGSLAALIKAASRNNRDQILSRGRFDDARQICLEISEENVALEMCKTDQLASDRNVSKISTFLLNVFHTNLLNGNAMNLQPSRLKIEGCSENGFSQLSLHFNLNKRN
jgi:hypothetical protein